MRNSCVLKLYSLFLCDALPFYIVSVSKVILPLDWVRCLPYHLKINLSLITQLLWLVGRLDPAVWWLSLL